MFKEQYLRNLQNLREAATDASFPAPPLPKGVSLGKPEHTPADTWEGLSFSQQFRSALQNFAGRVRNDEYPLEEKDYLRLTYPGTFISDEAADTILKLIEISVDPQRNETIPRLVEYVASKVHQEAPLQLIVSQCLEKSDEIRPGKLDYFLNNITQKREVQQFARGVEAKGWEKIERLIKEVSYPIEIQILIGDMDFFTLDGCGEWCDQSSLDRLPFEMAQQRNLLAHSVIERFGPQAPITVGLWSDRYNYSEFLSYFERARDPQSWRDQEALFGESREMYLNQWGYRNIGRELKLSEDQLDSFIREDVCRTAAQYRLESDIAIQQDAIQGWAEKVPKPQWPIRISGYDGRPTAPSLLLLGGNKE